MKNPPALVSALSGLLWGILGALLTYRSAGPHSVYAAIAGPGIGLAIYFLSRWMYSRGKLSLVLWTVVSTYIAVALFGLALGVADAFRPIERTTWGVIVQSVLACVWGLTFLPAFWLLFPLSGGNHLLIRWLERRRRAADAGTRAEAGSG